MCVIVIKPADVAIERTDLEAMFRRNRDGMGMAYFLDDGSVRIDKGYMTETAAVNAVMEHMEKSLVIHFRLTTHGKTCQEQCHPFVVSRDVKEAKTLDRADCVLFHNGVISGYGNDKISDTIHFACQVLSRIPDATVKQEVLCLTGDKFALLQEGKIYLVGEFKEYKGLMCSNLHFVASRVFGYPGTCQGMYGSNWSGRSEVGGQAVTLAFPAKTKEELERDLADKEAIKEFQLRMEERALQQKLQEESEQQPFIGS